MGSARDLEPRGRQAEMPLESSVRQPCAILLLLCGCVQSFPPHFANPKASATSLPLAAETNVSGSPLAHIWKDPTNLNRILREGV